MVILAEMHSKFPDQSHQDVCFHIKNTQLVPFPSLAPASHERCSHHSDMSSQLWVCSQQQGLWVCSLLALGYWASQQALENVSSSSDKRAVHGLQGLYTLFLMEVLWFSDHMIPFFFESRGIFFLNWHFQHWIVFSIWGMIWPGCATSLDMYH